MEEEQKGEHIVFVLYSFQRIASVVLQKVSYYIILCENESIILQHVHPNSPGNVFQSCGTLYSEIATEMNELPN